jgi:hypothetical protein
MNKMEEIRGFKVFNEDWTCRGFQYKVGETYKMEGNIGLCNRGFHFCKKAVDCFNYYDFNPKNKVAEVVATGKTVEDGDKCATNTITILREVSWQEVLEIVNTGKGNTGYSNSGNRNSGYRNSGDSNSGDWNSGYSNSGNRNSGYRNSGYSNSGDSNSGDWNSGYSNSGNRNSGYRNSGDSNSGDWNSGDWNSGDRNSGDWNSGDSNSGDWNSGDWNASNNNSGCFNTEQHKIMFFDKETDMTFKQWRDSEAYWLLNKIKFIPTTWIYEEDMTEEEKQANPSHETTGGYLRKNDLSNVSVEWWNELTEGQKQIIRGIPNYNKEKFSKIVGIPLDLL